MSQTNFAKGVQAARLTSQDYAENFSDLHPPFDAHEALVAADRCYFCHDAPCVTACPTDIDIPLFIRQIATGTPEAAARTILSQNILGGMCARVCPTETLCEEACVREVAEGQPVDIGRLQRFATDTIMTSVNHPFQRDTETGKAVAVVGAGPAGLSCAHRLAMHGHNVKIFDARVKAGGLNEFGIAAYKATDDFAAKEIEWLLGIGGIQIETGKALGRDMSLSDLVATYDAVFLGMGLSGVNALGLSGEDKDEVRDAVSFIADLRQSSDLSTLPVGRHVVVIGGGMTAVDAAVQSKLLGAQNVHLVYRRGRELMNASKYEQDLAASRGVNIITNAEPVAVHGNGSAREVEFAYTVEGPNGLERTDDKFGLKADQVLKAIGQKFEEIPDLVKTDGRKIQVSQNGRTSHSSIWAGGDCASGGDDLTVTAVAEGRNAAEDMHKTLMG